MKSYVVLAGLLALFSLAFAIAPVAQLGEFGGHLFFNVTPGGTQTMQFGVFNNDPNNTISYSLSYIIIYKVANQTIYPNVTVYPKSGLLLPNQNAEINVTVRVPGNAQPGMSWGGNVQFVGGVAPGTASGGASVRTGIVKIFNITVATPPFSLLSYIVPAAIVIGVGAGGGYYYFKVRKKAVVKRPARAARKPKPRKRVRVKAKVRKPKPRKRAKAGAKRTARKAPRKRATRRRRR